MYLRNDIIKRAILEKVPEKFEENLEHIPKNALMDFVLNLYLIKRSYRLACFSVYCLPSWVLKDLKPFGLNKIQKFFVYTKTSCMILFKNIESIPNIFFAKLFERLKNYNRYFLNQLQPSHSDQLLYQIANHFYTKGKIPQALYAYEKAIKEYPCGIFASKAKAKITARNYKRLGKS